VIVSKNIEYVKYMDNPFIAKDLKNDFSAFSIIDFYIVSHCTNFPFKKAAEAFRYFESRLVKRKVIISVGK
jgi:dipeptidase E